MSDLPDTTIPPQPIRVSDEDIEAAIGTLETAGILIVRRDDTGHVRWFTLRTTYGDDDLRKANGLEAING